VLRGPAAAGDVWNGGAHLGEIGTQGQHQVAVLQLRVPMGDASDDVEEVTTLTSLLAGIDFNPAMMTMSFRRVLVVLTSRPPPL
jgi:hypothetical protein